jgi:Uma2 family endonuclease
VVSPSNSVKEIREKINAYLAAGAEEVWVVFPQSARIECYGLGGEIERTRYKVDFADLFRS